MPAHNKATASIANVKPGEWMGKRQQPPPTSYPWGGYHSRRLPGTDALDR